MRFGKLLVPPDEYVQFRYSFGRHLDRLTNWNVKSVKALNFDIPTLNNAIVILGSTARGRGDYHFTPLDVFEGETAGVIVVANEVAAALSNKWLLETPLWGLALEKVFFILISTGIVWGAFWHPRLRRPAQISRGIGRLVRSGTRFIVVIAAVILVNFLLGWLVSFQLFKFGRVADPVTPVIAAVLDGLVDFCSITGERVAASIAAAIDGLVNLYSIAGRRVATWFE